MLKKKKVEKKGIALKPIKRSWVIENAYRSQLMKCTKLMLRQVMAVIENIYKEASPQITPILKDSVSPRKVYTTINLELNKWNKRFKKFAYKFSVRYVDEVDKSVKRQIKHSLSPVEPFFKVVKFSEHDKSILYAKQSVIQENVDLITNIVPKLKEQIQMHVTEAISRGRDLTYLEQKLRQTQKFTENRVKTIARDQINKATSVINHARQASLGITKQTWVYTGISKEPRQSHVKAAGTIYDIAKGCKIDGEYIFPGQKINCKCDSAPYIEFDIVNVKK